MFIIVSQFLVSSVHVSSVELILISIVSVQNMRRAVTLSIFRPSGDKASPSQVLSVSQIVYQSVEMDAYSIRAQKFYLFSYYIGFDLILSLATYKLLLFSRLIYFNSFCISLDLLAVMYIISCFFTLQNALFSLRIFYSFTHDQFGHERFDCPAVWPFLLLDRFPATFMRHFYSPLPLLHALFTTPYLIPCIAVFMKKLRKLKNWET